MTNDPVMYMLWIH